MSNYPNAVRIIPYSGDVATLNRVGPVPDPPWQPSWGDTRPYAQPAETPAILIAYAAQVRWEVDTKGITFTAASGAIPVNCDRISQGLIGDLVQYAATVAGTTSIDFTQDGVHYALLASEVPTMFTQVYALIQQARTIEAACIADQNLATPTMLTYADIDNKFSGVFAATRGGKR
jgi:hypothetical protein